MVHQHQCLQPMNAGVAIAKSLPASSFDQPASCQLYQASVLRIGDQIGISRAKCMRRPGAHQRILEETPGIAQLPRVRQLFTANGADRTADIHSRGLDDPLLRQPLADRAVFKMQRSLAAQSETHPQDQVAPRHLLENAVAIGECAVGQREVPKRPGFDIQCRETGEDILDLDPIGTDVLNW